MAEQDIDNLVNHVSSGGTLTLSPPRCEFEGPVIVRKPLTLVGQQGLIWAKKGPVLRIECSGVVLQDLSVEITGREEKLTGEEACAIVVAPGLGLTLNDVCVRGNVSGLSEEEGNWRHPRSLRMKAPPGQKQEFHVKFTVPVPCRLVSNIAGVTVEPSNLKAGETDVKLVLDPLAPGVRVRGEISLKSAFLVRQIDVSANVGAAASEADRFQVTFWDSLSAGPPPVGTPQPTQEPSATTPEPTPSSRPARKPGQKPRDTAEKLGPEPAPAPEPIPEKLQPKSGQAKPRGRQVPDVFGKEKAAPPPTPAGKIKSVPLTDLWSPSAAKAVNEEPPSDQSPQGPQQPTPVAKQDAQAQPPLPAEPVTNATDRASESTKADAGAASRKRPVLDFSAFKASEPPAAPKTEPADRSACQSADRDEQDESKLAAAQPTPEDKEEQVEKADSKSRSSEPKAPKPKKLRKTNGNLGAFGGGTD